MSADDLCFHLVDRRNMPQVLVVRVDQPHDPDIATLRFLTGEGEWLYTLYVDMDVLTAEVEAMPSAGLSLLCGSLECHDQRMHLCRECPA